MTNRLKQLVTVQYLHSYVQKFIPITYGDGIFACKTRDFSSKNPRGILPTEQLQQLLIVICIIIGLTGCGESQTTKYNKSASGKMTTEAVVKELGVEELENYGDSIPDDSSGMDDTRKTVNDETSSTEKQSMKNGETLEVHYIDVGQGDSILIKQGETTMLIDAGNNDKGTTVWSYLLSQKVESLDYAICTHPDADHIGGMDVVLYKLDCDTIFMPACEHDTETYSDLITTIGQRSQKVVVPKRGENYSLGKAHFQILTDTEKNYGDNKNDYSIAIRLTFGETSFLFTGDAEEEAEQDMQNSGLLLASNVYKVAHHGANWANTLDFLTAVNPMYAVISCGEGNSYGHPRAEVLNNLRSMGVKVFRTDEQGSIVAVSDGTSITFNCSPSESWKAGEPTGSGQLEEAEHVGSSNDNSTGAEQGNSSESDERAANQGTYVLNTNSKKIHRPDCGSVNQMSEENKAYSNESKEELIDQGYEPCKNCEP